MKFGVADYGMNVWAGGLYDIEERLQGLRKLGYSGTERLEAGSPADAIYKSAVYRKLGMDYSTCLGPDVQSCIQWTAALGKKYVWLAVGENTRNTDFDVFCRKANLFAKSCKRWGIRAAVHNHLGQRIESQQELEDFLKKCPDIGIVFDTGHLAGAGGDPVEIVKKYHDRICVMHLKDVYLINPEAGLETYTDRLRFCELGAGNTGLDNMKVMKALVDVGYDGWVHIEHDTHMRDPLIDLRTSINLLKNSGFVVTK